jgi:hypothetical protein
MRLMILLIACGQPQYVSGHLHCAASGRACPDDFYCGAGGLCWKNGSGPEMGAADLAMPSLEDLAMLPIPDLAGSDFAGADLKPLPDLSVAFDLSSSDMSHAVSLCPGTYKLCDGFEAATISSANWNQDTNGGTFTIDTGFAYRGNQSLHIHNNGSANAGANPFTNLTNFSAFPLSGTAYARAFFYFPPSYPGAFNQVLNFANGSGDGAAFATKNGHPVLNDYTAPTAYNESATTIPTGKWVCLSLSIAQGASTGTAKLFVDDVEVADVTATGVGTPTMSHIYIGVDWVNNPASFPANDVWVDEVIINDSPVTCAM